MNSQTILQSLANPTSFVDLVTNHTTLSQFDFRVHLKPLNEFMIAPELLPTFLHELTHHSCFTSPLGLALSALKLKVLKSAIWRSAGARIETDEIVRDLVTYDSAITTLKPYAEGLALFAEYDVWSGEALTFSRTTTLLQVWTSGYLDKMETRMDPVVFHSSMSTLFRTQEGIREHKSNLLVHPLDTRDNPYLAGYLTVKNLWQAYILRGGRLDYSDVFLSFLESYVYEDIALISILLDETKSAEQRSKRLGQYLFDRIHDLFYTDIVRSIEEFRDFSLSSREGGFGNLLEIDESHVPVLDVIGQNTEMASQGRKLLVSLVRRITGHNQVPPEHRGYDLMSWLNVIFLGQRHYICIGSKQFKVQIKENGAAVVLDDFGVLCGGPAQGEFSPGIRDGVVEYYVIPRFSLGVLSVAVDGRNVFSVFSNDNNVTAREEFLREKRDRFRMQDTFEYLHQYLEKTIKESGAQEQSDSLIKEIEVGTSRIYGYLGSLPFGGHEGTVAKEFLSVSGFYELFESDEQLVRSFALVSLLAGTGISVEEVRSVLAEQGFDYDQLLTRITRLEQKYSLELLRVSQDVVVTWI